MSVANPLRGLREATLTLGAVAGALCVVVVLLGLVLDVRPLLFRSGSMAPTLRVGDLAVARSVPADQLRSGDIVSVIDEGGQRVTHRIVGITGESDSRELTLQGDANSVPDRAVYPVTRADKVIGRIPVAGHLVAAASSITGRLVLVAFTGLVLLLVLRRPRDPDPPRSRRHTGGRRKAERTPRAGLVGARRVGVMASGVVLASGAWAASAEPWTDTVNVSAPLAAAQLPKPTITSCTVTGGALSQKTATIVWPEVGAWDYVALIAETGRVLSVTDNGATRQTQFNAGLLSTVMNATYQVEVRAVHTGSTWTSVQARQPVTITSLGLGMSCGTPS